MQSTPAVSLIEPLPTTIAACHGLLFGDGVFTTLRVNPQLAEVALLHTRRLVNDAQQIGIELPASAMLAEAIVALVAARDPQRNGVLRITAVRRKGQGYRPDWPGQAALFYSLHPPRCWPDVVRLQWCNTPLGHNPVLAGIKHLSRLEQVLAAHEIGPEFDEGIMCDVDNNVIEGTVSNLLWRTNGQFHTPALGRCGVNGLARQTLLRHHSKDQPVRVQDYSRDELLAADHVWVMNSVRGIAPVCRIGDTEFTLAEDSATLARELGPLS